MRISDWSSDVCSSDLRDDMRLSHLHAGRWNRPNRRVQVEFGPFGQARLARAHRIVDCEQESIAASRVRPCGEAERKSVVRGKSVSVRVDRGGRRSIKKKRRGVKEERREVNPV